MKFQKYFLFILICTVFTGCGNKSGQSGGGDVIKPKKANFVNWEDVQSDFNPKIEDISFRTDGVEKINIDAFGFDKDVEVIYSPEVLTNEGVLRIFKVWKKQASWGDLRPKQNGFDLDLKNYGSYQCSIRVENGLIVELEGGCYVRLQVFLPVGAEIEVYNVGRIITKRFIPIDNETFLDSLDDAVWADDKFIVIENFLASYVGNKKPTLTSYEMGKVIKEFSRSEEKFKALRRLHQIVSDRENLGKMIDSDFGYFDREEARKIVGIN